MTKPQSTLTLELHRNLRRSLLQGNPWIYREAFREVPSKAGVQLCRVLDQKKAFVGWGFFAPEGPLAVRMLSLDKKPPAPDLYAQRLERALRLRHSLIHQDGTNCFRLINGEGDLMPGFICDVYADTAVIQLDGPGPFEFWDQEWLAQWLLNNLPSCQRVYLKPRHDARGRLNATPQSWGQALEEGEIAVRENGRLFFVDIVQGQKTGFFLDQRDNREYVRSLAKAKRVLNLFSYSGGFSVAAGQGEALEVTSVDMASEALRLAEKNWQANDLNPTLHHAQVGDAFEYIANCKDSFDLIICDPPSLAKSEAQKPQAIAKYTELFVQAAKCLTPGGDLLLSSCSSHISFSDFEDIVAAALSKARKTAQVLRVSGQGSDHPYPHALTQMRYLKFYHLVL